MSQVLKANQRSLGELFEAERNRLLKSIEIAKDPVSKLGFLKELREADWVVPGYQNSLGILSDQTYQDRKHFLLELIQNADDADYGGNSANISFSVKSDTLVLRYNEKGFLFDDVFAITDTGNSTKKRDKVGANSFIGEKGIGFKSVFALAKKVEIESPPWHFILTKEKPIVPIIVPGKTIEEGTQLTITFINPDIIEDVADELESFISGALESFLFLRKLSSFTLEDHRYSPLRIKRMEVNPLSRQGTHLQLKSMPLNMVRDYVVYSEKLTFPAELVAERWEQLSGIGPLDRTLSVAALIHDDIRRFYHGRVFCFLPTRVGLPVPLYLQLDGVTTADREKLHDLNSNSWNSYLISNLPDFLMRAILFLRTNPITAQCLPDYIPHDEEKDQLKQVFSRLINILCDTEWIRTCDEGDSAWATPKQSIIANQFLYKWILKYPDFRKRVEQKLGKRFMSADWADEKAWGIKWTQYNIPKIQDYHIASILANVQLPEKLFDNEENLIALYDYILKVLNNRSNPNFISKIKRAPIFPVEGEGFAPLEIDGENNQIFYLSTQAVQRQTGVEELADYRLITREYTYSYRFDPKKDPPEKKEAIGKINLRNRSIRDLLRELGVEALDNDSLLRLLQIPWLLDRGNARPELDQSRNALLKAIFEAFSSKREPDQDYLDQLASLKNALFPYKDGNYLPLDELTLPPVLRMENGDGLYSQAGIPSIIIPGELLELPSITKGRFRSPDEEANIRQHRQKWRDFLIKCGLRVRPGWVSYQVKYDNCSQFKQADHWRYMSWIEIVKNNYTENNPVVVEYIILDKITSKLLLSPERDMGKLASVLYESWKVKFGKLFDNGLTNNANLYPGFFTIRHRRYRSETTTQIRDKNWAGIDYKLIPLKTIDKKAVPAGIALKIQANLVSSVQITSQHMALVGQSERGAEGYHPRYLESLVLSFPGIKVINELWDKIEPQQYGSIIQIAIELLKANIINPDGLMIYDKDIKKLRPYDDFRLGGNALPGIPLIEKQYDEAGRTLGQLLKLRSESKITTYLQLIEQLYAKLPKSLDLYHGQILNLLDEWASLDENSRHNLIQATDKARKKKALDLPIVFTYNQDTWAQKLKNAGYPVLSLQVTERQKYKLQRAARELGFSSIEDEGQLKTQKKVDLSDSEANLLKEYLQTYEKLIGDKEAILLEEKINLLGKKENLAVRIKRVKSACREILLGKNMLQINVELPFLDVRDSVYLVNLEDEIQVILANLLSALEFAPKHSVLRDLKELKNQIEPAFQPPQDKVKDNQQEHKEYQKDPDEVARALKKSLTDPRPAPEPNESNSKWKTGFNPEQEENFRKKQLESYKRSLEEGPKEYERKARLRNQRSREGKNVKHRAIIDLAAVNPKQFLMAEYNGYCQICGTDLPLVNGGKWIETYHINENNGQEWLRDRPFNILGLCPNCHALAKHGGRNFINLYKLAYDLELGNAIPQELEKYNMDGYVTTVKINGSEKELVMSKLHLNHMAVGFAPLIVSESEAAAAEDETNEPGDLKE